MVCNKSLYCWKYGPCASDQARKKIWEENIKFRKNLKDANQSDHYWTFQISQNLCTCIEEEELFHGKQILRKSKSQSLQKLNDIDCASITHDLNGLKYRNCYIHYPKENIVQNDKVTSILTSKKDVGTCTRCSMPFSSLNKPKKKEFQFCHRYLNTLSDTYFKPITKIKFSSQENLLSKNKGHNVKEKKSYHLCHQDILSSNLKKEHNYKKNENILKMIDNVHKNNGEGDIINEKQLKKEKILKEFETEKALKQINDQFILQNRKSPLLKPSQKELQKNKKFSISKFDGDDKNIDLLKNTESILPSKIKVHPNVLSAKQQKRINSKVLQVKNEVKRKFMPENVCKRKINHSSLWCVEQSGNNNEYSKKSLNKSQLIKTNFYKKTIDKGTINLDSCPYKTYRKPQIHFH